MKLKHMFMLLISGYVLFSLVQVFQNKTARTPVLSWWTPFINIDRVVTCQNNQECQVLADRDDQNIEVYLFYGSNIDLSDLPLPKKHPWAIFHEESPKNLPMLLDENVQNIFDISSTFNRNSDFPITLQYLKQLDLLTSRNFYIDLPNKNKMLDELAPVLYIQSDCDTPIERDKIIKELMQYVKVDSYGKCLNNKKLPDALKINRTIEIYSEEVMEFVARYKFVIAVENSRCSDYVTEKLWRPLIVGSVPIYMGAETIKDWLPNEKSAILFDDFPSIKSLAEYINLVNSRDDLYLSHLEHKTEGKITNEYLKDRLLKGYNGVYSDQEDVISAFECFVCEKLHGKEGLLRKSIVRDSYYSCDTLAETNSWYDYWKWAHENAKDFINKVTIKN